jgi:hypothetical protein
MSVIGKLPGKTAYSGIRRPVTRTAGVTTHSDTTGGEWNTGESTSYALAAGDTLEFDFSIPQHSLGEWIAFGGWFYADHNVRVALSSPYPKFTLTGPCAPDWSKFGSMWQGDGNACGAKLVVTAIADTEFATWDIACGIVENPGCYSGEGFIECDSPNYLKKMYDISPEAHFWKSFGTQRVAHIGSSENVFDANGGPSIVTKSCNRCGRYLPVNVHNERNTLSFSNHCVAKRPCKHSLFGKLRHVVSNEQRTLDYGFQLECRFCKKYCVNWLHNRQRTAAQMKEDATRRRYFERLISELFQESKDLSFKYRTGKELTDHIWEKFGKECFNCGENLPTANDMHRDHTRPLALLWPLDETATALCGPCNSSKSDKSPVEFYELPEVLERLSTMTGIPLADLESPAPNLRVIEKLLERLDWFFEDFLTRDDMTKERDGKVAAELVVKALQKTLDRCPDGAPIDLMAEYKQRLAAQNRI